MRRKSRLTLPLLLALAFVSLLPAAGMAEAGLSELDGLITEVLEGGILIADDQRGSVLLHVDAETVLEGILGEEPLAAGMYVFAKYIGDLSPSVPPQAHAIRLGCYALKGIVAETEDGGIAIDDILDALTGGR